MKKLALTIGDAAGLGPEIIKKWAHENPSYADRVCILAHKKFLECLPKAFEGLCIDNSDIEPRLGKPTIESAKIAYNALESAALGCLEGRFCAVTTAPTSKSQMSKVGFNFAGQTEFFQERWGGDAVMSFAGSKLITSLVTWHIPLKEVSNCVDEKRISSAVAAADFLAKKLRNIKDVRIAVCGINPHAGEDGLLGDEEKLIINPILKKLQNEYGNLSLCLPSDTVFMRTLKGEFDAIVSMYHDQALAPLKALEFDEAVNISMGLKYVRTSPDHGTGFDIAGKGIASCNSLKNAIDCALKLVH